MPKDNTGTDARTGGKPGEAGLCGLIVRLEKDILWSKHCGDTPILGYFDHVGLQQIHHWLQFSPRTTAVELQDGGEESPLSMYPIKLIFPEPSVVSGLEERAGLSYTSWMGNLSELLAQYPCVTIMLVNLTDEFKGKIPRDPCGAQLERFVHTIREGRFLFPGNTELDTFSPAQAADAHLCIMPSLGYSDYCILLAEKSWYFSSALVEFLHRAAYAGPDAREAVPILSTDYVIPAYHAIGGAAQEDSFRQGLQFSMRIHLRPGASMFDIRRAAGEKIEVYQLSGSSDCVLVSNDADAFHQLLGTALVADDKSGGGRPIRNLVVSTEATLLRPIRLPDALPQETVAKIKPSDRVDGQIRQLREILRNYWTFLCRENRHMRQFNSIWDCVTSIESICKEPHNGTLQEIMVSWLDAFTDCLDRCVKQIGQLVQEGESRETVCTWLDYVDDVLEAFGTEAGGLLADLSRSDCFSMESERYNHPSVSSATALLIAYNRWQNSFVSDVLSEDPDNRCKYVFLVRSGGCDTTTTNNLFYSLEPEVETISESKREILAESMPLITQMSEMSLFDCGGTVLRMTHECMHYCGERLRRPRVTYMIDFTARCFAVELTRFLFSEEGYPKHILAEMKAKFLLDGPEFSRDVFQAWEDSAQDLREKIAVWLAGQLKTCYDAERERWNERDHMSDNLRQWILDKMIPLFSPYHCEEDKQSYRYSIFVEFLYQAQTETVLKFYNRCDAVVRRYRKGITCLALDCRWLKEDTQDAPLRQGILWALNQLLMDPVYGTGAAGIAWPLQNKGLIDILEKVVFDCFSECFADIEACIRLDAGLPDYLLGFAFEEWDVDNAIPMDAPYSFRIPAVLRVCFGGRLTEDGAALKAEAADALKDAIRCLAERGLPEPRQNAGALIARINELLAAYQTQRWIAQPLEDYLRCCLKYYAEHEHPNMQKYQTAFRQICLLTGRGDNNVARLFTNLIAIGEVDGNGKAP